MTLKMNGSVGRSCDEVYKGKKMWPGGVGI